MVQQNKGCRDFHEMIPGQLAIDLNPFSFIRNKKSKTLWSALFIRRGHQLNTNKKLRRP
jgi:hypothetical protein